MGDTYTLMGTIGQPDAGSHSGTGYDLTGGFWAWVARYLGYLPFIKRPYNPISGSKSSI